MWFSVAFGNNNVQEPQPVDLVVILSAGCEEILKVDHIAHEPCCNELLAACKDDQIVIISPSVLYGMLRRKRNGQDGINECLEKIARQYTVYLNNDEDFVILLPASYNAKGLRELGFDESQVTAIEPESLMRFYEGKWASRLIEIDHFKKLFKTEDFQYKAPAKSIYLISHGIDALDEIKDFSWSMPLISSLSVWQFVNFLQMLNTINTQFLHIASCYAAGANFFNVERILSGIVEDERCHNPQEPLHFPIMIQGTTDSPVSAIIGSGPGCKSFFSLIREWLQHDKDTTLLSEGLSRNVYTLKHIALGPNFPLLKLSGPVPTMSIPVQGTVTIKSDGTSISAHPDVRYLFFYPSVLNNTTIALESLAAAPQCISKVVGRACHFIGTIQVQRMEEKSVLPMLQACFLKEVVRNYDEKSCYGVSDKAWFIQRMIADDAEHTVIAKGVIVLKGMLKYGIHKALILYQDAHNLFHRVEMPLPFTKTTVRHDTISEQEYVQTAARIYWETKADEQALAYAAGCSEQCWHVQESFHSFLRTLDLSMPTADVHTYVQQDIAHMRNGSLKKEAYLRYVAYIHDESILNELTAACSDSVCDVLNFHDIETILMLGIDTEWHDICLRVVQELLRKNNIAAQQAALNTLNYMISMGLYVHASRACQDILNCFDTMALLPALNGSQLKLEQSMRNFFAALAVAMVKEKQAQAAELIMIDLVQHDQWYRYGLGIEVCTQLIEQDTWDLAQLARPRLQWFVANVKNHLTQEALAVYFDQTHIVEAYMQHLSIC
jgi:hypothetical protein